MTKKVLIVEDDAFLVDAYQMKMSGQTDWKVVVATDGDKALEKAKEKPDLIILDMLLEKKSGIEVLKELKADEETESIPVVVASNVDQEGVVKKALDFGAVDYFIKSDISIADLIKKCEKYL